MFNISPAPVSAVALPTTIAFVQSKTVATAVAASSVDLVFDATPTAGNWIMLAVAYSGNTFGIRATEAGSNMTFMSHIYAGQNQSNVGLLIGRVFSSTTATVTISLNGTQTSNIAVVGAEYTGYNLRADRLAFTATGSTTAATGSAPSSSTANELWLAALSHRNTSGATFSAPTNSFRIVDQVSSTSGVANTDRTAALLERIVTSTGVLSTGATISSNNNWAAIGMGFDERRPAV